MWLTAPEKVRRLRLVVSALVLVVIGGGLSAVAQANQRESSSERGREVAATVAGLARAAAATTSTAPTVPMPTLPQPVRVPDEDYAGEPEVVVGRIQIPALGLDSNVYEGISLTAIDRGPSHWPGTAMPGQLGNVVIAGHRVTHSRPFRHLDQLKAGDQAILTSSEGTFTYEFVSQEIVTPDRVDIADQTAEHRATFFACHPPNSARYRIVAHWRLISTPLA